MAKYRMPETNGERPHNDSKVSVGHYDDRRAVKDDRAERRIREMERNAPPPTTRRKEY